MVPPTGVSDSIGLTVERNGASQEPFYGALAPQPKNRPMEPKESRIRKTLGEKWKSGKTGKSGVESQMIEASNFMVHPDYLTKYGTLSNGVLTKSIKYAETWLYGTVGVRGAPTQRPSLFLYPGVVAPAPRIVSQSNYLSSPSAYIGVSSYPSSERSYVISQPRKRAVKQSDGQVYQCSDCGKDIRSGGTCSLCKKCLERRNGTARRSRASAKESPSRRAPALPSPDPYGLMRKTRLGMGEVTEASLFAAEHPQRRKRTASASPLRKATPASPVFQTFKPKDTKPWKSIEDEWSNGEDEVGRRKSILECDLNAYELNKSKPRDVEDSGDEFGEGLSKVHSKLKIVRAKLNKTDLRSEKPETTKTTEEVRLNGQRFRIFDHSNPSTGVVEGYVSDDEECRKPREPLIPRLPSPKRPPRRPKDRILGETAFKYSKSKSKSSPNLSIKSILKKPGGGEDGSVSEVNAVQCEETPNAAPSDTSHHSPVNKKQSQSTLKKKKQVQFRVNVSNESLNKGVRTEDPDQKQTENVHEPLLLHSDTSENLSPVSTIINQCETGSETDNEDTECLDRKDVAKDRQRGFHTQEEPLVQPSQPPQLKRSYSDRRPSSALVLYKDDSSSLSTSPPSSHLFNDTMALRTRTTRLDTREVFTSGKTTPSPEPKLPSNVISYQEFSKRTEPGPCVEETSAKKFEAGVCPSGIVKKKSQAPSPPPRQVSSKSSKGKSGAISVKVSSVPCEHLPKNSSSLAPSGSFVEVKAFEAESKQKVGGEEGRVLVRLNSVEEAAQVESPVAEGRRTSVTIHPQTLGEEPKTHPQRKTSVLINAFDPQDANKVTISVRNEEESNASTCTIIETGSNSTVIPVVSTDNKTTLIVGSTPLASASVHEAPSPPEQEAPKSYIFSTVSSEIDFLDPVEAVRRNLVPHICGKEENGLSLMEKMKQSRKAVEAVEQRSLKQISQLFGRAEESSGATHSLQFVLPSLKNKKAKNWKGASGEDSSTTTSRSNSFCSTLNGSVKNSSGDTSRSSSFRSSCCKSLDSDYDASPSKFYQLSDAEDVSGQERDKLEYEYEIRNGFKEETKEESENIYETIREEPIYEQIGVKGGREEVEEDVPPPLPLTLPPSLDDVDKRSTKSIFEGASKYDILNYLVDAKDRVQEECYFSGSSTSEDADGRREGGEASGEAAGDARSSEERLREGKGDESPSGENDSGYEVSSRMSNLSQTSYSSDDNIGPGTSERESLKLTRKSSAEIERNDSGVGSETSQTSRSKWQAGSSIREDPQHLCEDCDQVVETQVTESGVMYAPLVCRKCSKRRSERKEIIQEIVETEEKYGRDLKIILEEFYTPMLVAGLLTPEQLSAIFLNTEELLENSEQLTEKLRDTLEIAVEQGDEDLLTVNMGKLFLEAGPMLHAFESYCTRQGAAAVLLANLEKEKELLRIFLRVSQMENAVLRRMNLNSFLMVPVQRVTKYPLLLARLYKVTPSQQEGRELLREAQHNIELHLEHMNSEAKDVSATKVWRRFSTSAATGRKSTSELEMINIKLRKMAVDVLEWNHEEVRFVLEGKLLYTQPTDNNWKRGRTIKLTPIFVLLVTLGKPNSKYKVDPPDDELTFPTKTGVREATLLLVKEKCGRYTLIREPLYLDKIIVCCEADVDEFFEIQDLSTKDSFIFKAEDGERTKEWYKYLQYHAQILGSWRRRRNALANIMINGMMARAYTT